MKIDKIYYEELRSVFIDGKWANKRLGVGASLDDENDQLSNRLDDLKTIVKRELDRDTIEPENKYEKLLEDIIIKVEALKEDDVPF